MIDQSINNNVLCAVIKIGYIILVSSYIHVFFNFEPILTYHRVWPCCTQTVSHYKLVLFNKTFPNATREAYLHTNTVMCFFRFARKYSKNWPTHNMAKSLKASVGPWNNSRMFKCDERRAICTMLELLNLQNALSSSSTKTHGIV